MKPLLIVVVAAGLIALPPMRLAAADPVPKITIPTELLDPATVTTDAGKSARMDAGDWLVPKERWDWRERELITLQDDKTRCTAENESMRTSLEEMPSTWYWIAGAFSLGLTVGLGYDEIRDRWF